MALIRRLGAAGAALSLALPGSFAAAAPPVHAGATAGQTAPKIVRPKVAGTAPAQTQQTRKTAPVSHHR